MNFIDFEKGPSRLVVHMSQEIREVYPSSAFYVSPFYRLFRLSSQLTVYNLILSLTGIILLFQILHYTTM